MNDPYTLNSNEFQPFFRAGKRLSEKLLDRAFLFDR